MPLKPPTYEFSRLGYFLRASSPWKVLGPGGIFREMKLHGESLGPLTKQDTVLVVQAAKDPGGGRGKEYTIDEAIGAHAVIHRVLNNDRGQRVYELVFCFMDETLRAQGEMLLAARRDEKDRKLFYSAEQGDGFFSLQGNPELTNLFGLQEARRRALEVLGTGRDFTLAHPLCAGCDTIYQQGLPGVVF